MYELLLLIPLSAILTYLFIKFFSGLFYKYWILDNPKKYGYKRDPIPYPMGFIFVIVFSLISFPFFDHNTKYYLMLLFWLVITTVSFFDDRLNLSPKVRLIIQIIIWAAIWITSIKIGYISNIFGWIIDLETYFFTLFWLKIYLIPLIFTIIWYVLIFNSLNWSDWLTWVTSWISFISFFVLLLLALILFKSDHYEWAYENAKLVVWTCSILIWILWVYWFFDVKEKMLMWDSGTMYLGFMLATIAIIAWWKIATVWVVFGIYLIDAFYVIISRLLRKQSPLKWDMTHLHHRLNKIWLTKKEILITIYSLSFIFWLSALFLDKTWKIIVFFIIAFVVIFITKILNLIKK